MLGYIISALIGAAFINMINEEKEKEKARETEMWAEREIQSSKRREALTEFNYRKQEIYNSFSNEFSKQLSEDIDFCKKDLNQYDVYISYFNEGIKNITKIENEKNLFSSRIDNYIEKSSNN